MIKFLSDNSIGGTPVPISNTEVKPNNANNSNSKDRKSLRIFFLQFFKHFIVLFLCYNIYR